MAYSGKYKSKNPKKYKGDPTKIIYRSMWEKYCMMFFDSSTKVKFWSSEEVVIPYLYEADRTWHRYYPDFKVWWADGSISVIEVKPKKETAPPAGKRRTKQYMKEAYTFIKNVNKWEAAKEICKDNKWNFEIWTEDDLDKKGIKPKSTKSLKPYRRKAK